MQGTVGIADDMNVFGTESTHAYNLHEAMERARRADIKLNFDKCIVSQNLVVSLVKYTVHKEYNLIPGK